MLAAFSVTPLGVSEGVSGYVADAVRVVRESGLPNRTDAMFTTIEGERVGFNKPFLQHLRSSEHLQEVPPS